MLDKKISPWPSYSIEEADKARDVLLSNKVNYWTGSECKAFEREFSNKFNIIKTIIYTDKE